MQKSIRRLAAVLAMTLMLAGCGGGAAQSDDWSEVSSVVPVVDEDGVPQMTWELYENRGGDGVNLVFFHGRVTAAVLQDDSYGTPYYHLQVRAEDGNVYEILSNRMEYEMDYEVEKEYLFYVSLAAARGVLVDRAEAV